MVFGWLWGVRVALVGFWGSSGECEWVDVEAVGGVAQSAETPVRYEPSSGRRWFKSSPRRPPFVLLSLCPFVAFLQGGFASSSFGVQVGNELPWCSDGTGE